MILKLSKDKKLTFYRKNPIYIGEKDFDTIEVLIPLIVDNNETNNLNFILHLVNKNGEYLHINLDKEIKEDMVVGSTKISSTITNEAQNFFLYLELIKENNEIIGKTNCVEITIEPLPDEDTRIIPKEEYEEIIDELAEIIQKNTDAMNRINEFEDGKSAYEIAVEYGYEGTEEEWLQSLNGKDGKSAYEIAVERGYEGTEEEWLSEMKDYSKLNNKPSINSIKLFGNKTSDELGLQKKLTAGTNISIDDNGTISASNRTNDYQKLENLPMVEGNDGSPHYSLTYGLNFDSAQFNTSKRVNGLISVQLWNVTREILDRGWSYFVGGEIQDLPEFHYRGIYDFNQLTITVEDETVNYKKAGYWIMQGINCRNVPQAFSNLVSDNTLLIVSHFAGYPIYEENKLFLYRTVYLLDSQNHVRIFSQYCKTFIHEAERVQNISDWQELNAGGSQLVSGAVNQNGTITFTDSDGNTFTTTGASVIGADGFSPVATVTQTESGATVSITDKNGTTTANISNGADGADGQDYVLTPQDKTDIANIVLSELPTTQGILYGD